MKICIIASQILGFDKIGGFGSMTRQLATHLAKKHEVVVLVPRRTEQKKTYTIDGFTIITVTKRDMIRLQTYRDIDADIYHSQNPTLMTFFAKRAEPSKVHIATARDPRSTDDWIAEITHATPTRMIQNIFAYFFEAGPIIRYAMQHMHVVGTPAFFLQKKAKQVYGLSTEPIFLPNIEDVPTTIKKKATQPTVLFVGRLDKIKNPDKYISLAESFPHVRFILVGKAEQVKEQKRLEQRIQKIPNIDYKGFVNKFESDTLAKLYEEAWIVINTSVKEGLPITFIEGAARGCAILSALDQDDFASRFGEVVHNNNYKEALEKLLKHNAWKEKGKKAHAYVQEHYSSAKALQKHEDIYTQLGPKPIKLSKDPLVTIMIPTYNQERTIAQTIKSALDQDYPNIEVIVSDDCSTDETNTVIEKFKPDSRLKHKKHTKNVGRVNNYYRLVHTYAKGELALSLDGDDFLNDPTYIRRAVALLQQHKNMSMVFGKIQIFIDTTSTIIQEKVNSDLPEVIDGNTLFLDYHTGYSQPHLTTVYYRQLACDLQMHSVHFVSTDWEGLLKMMIGYKVGFINEYVGTYRKHNTNLTKEISMDVVSTNLQYITRPYAYALEKRIASPEVLDRWKNHMLRRYFVKYLVKARVSNNVYSYKEILQYVKQHYPHIEKRISRDPRMFFFNVFARTYIMKLVFRHIIKQEGFYEDIRVHSK